MAVKPTLLLSPDGSFDANGRVEPTISGGVLVVPGQYSNAWHIAEATTNLIPNPGFETGKGAWVSAQGEIDSTDFAPGGGTTSLKVTISTSGALLASTAGPLGTYSIEIAPNTTYTVSFWAKASKAGSYRTYHPWRNSSGSLISTPPRELSAYHDYTTEWQRFSHTFTTPSDATIARTYMALYGTDGHAAGDIVWIDNVQFEAKPYATPYADGSLGSGYAWTGTPHASSSTRAAASVSAPLATAPQSVLVRYSEDGGTTHLDAHRIGAGTFGTYGNITYSGGALTVAPSPPSVQIESMLLFDTVLTVDEIAEYTNMQGAWTHNNTFGPSESIVFPDIRSGLHLVETKIHKSDMYGNIGDEITGEVVAAGITSDLDRAGSKTHIDITAVGAANLLPAGSWVTPVQGISREGEGTIKVQRGVFELGQPEVESAGVRFIVSNSGRDIVDLLARSALLDTFYTPVGGYVMGDVELAIRMLGITSMGPNLLPNGSFEDNLTGWAGPHHTSGGSGTYQSVIPQYPAPDGGKQFALYVPPLAPSGARTYIYQDITSLPPGANRLFTSAVSFRFNVNEHAEVWAEFRNASGARIRLDRLRFTDAPAWAYQRLAMVSDVPEGTITVRVYAMIDRDVEGQPSTRSAIDDIQVRPCTGDLLPASMLAMPPSTAKATSRIQHLTSDARLAAVNDRLSAISMMAVNATSDSKYTSRMSRDPNKDASVRQYEIEKDIRITGDIQTWRNTSNKYNRVFAVKEDYTEGTVMTAIAENKDLDDPWNIYRSVLTPRRIDVRDAVDVATLQIAADQELAKASMQESVSFSIVPDPTLTVYDIIEITGPDTNPAIGKWAIESIDSGLTASDPLMHIGARRTKKGV